MNSIWNLQKFPILVSYSKHFPFTSQQSFVGLVCKQIKKKRTIMHHFAVLEYAGIFGGFERYVPLQLDKINHMQMIRITSWIRSSTLFLFLGVFQENLI
ncbi:hypothetical protein PAECIP111893_01306 [Paenibacillus plantiphilus]|uniref:Uncharacterized protein n=1 Tax=Paenibacillus plantiphilus TaxID=2905650 RepID=A0ABM9C117_9BACL|nr:hypothetical protein PAECIP111893_01306 [Paenibacillus plantiphilus]